MLRPDSSSPPARAKRWLQIGLGIARRKPVAAVAAVYIALIVLTAVFASVIAPANPNELNYTSLYDGPSAQHLLGTDELGRDLLSRLIFGGRVSLIGVSEALVVFLLLGLILGLIAGYFSGLIDGIIVFVADVSFGVPQIIVVLAVLAIFSNNSTAAMLVLGFLSAPGLAMLTRGATRAVRKEQYIAAARVSGLRSHQIISRHILPRIAGPVIVQTSLFAGVALIFQTGLDFLGIGTQPPTASWGGMVAEGSNYLTRDWWMVLPSGAVIALTITAFALIGDAVRDWNADRSIVAPAITEPATELSFALVALDAPEAVRLTTERSLAQVDAASGADGTLVAGQRKVTRRPGSLLSVDNLSIGILGKSGNTIPLVDGICLDLDPGECLGLVGESGCGKTMSVLAIMGLLPTGVVITEGSITLNGTQLQAMNERELRRFRGSLMSMISQEPVTSLDPSFTVGSQVAEVVRRHSSLSRRASKREALRLLELVELPDARGVASKYPHELSGGMAQRVAIAAALAGKPELLIADEPTTALDVTVQADILALLRSLRAKTGLGVLLVSHDWGVIADSCDGAIVMYAGRSVETGEIGELFSDPRHPYTRGLMSSNPYYALQPRAQLPSIPGSVPAVGNWPDGCRFAPRCPFATHDCIENPVAEESLGLTHRVRCIHHDALPALPVWGGGAHGA